MTAIVRPMLPTERRFVVSTWSSSYRTSDYAGLLSMATYADVMHREVERIIDHPSTRTFVAEEPGEVDHLGRPFVYGFLARHVALLAAGPTRQPMPYVYYVYVKTSYRQGRERYGLERGYAAQLFAGAGIDPRRPFEYACETPISLQLASKIPLGELNTLPARYLETP